MLFDIPSENTFDEFAVSLALGHSIARSSLPPTFYLPCCTVNKTHDPLASQLLKSHPVYETCPRNCCLRDVVVYCSVLYFREDQRSICFGWMVKWTVILIYKNDNAAFILWLHYLDSVECWGEFSLHTNLLSIEGKTRWNKLLVFKQNGGVVI